MTDIQEITPLAKHTYPWWLRIAFYCIVIIFITTLTHFVCFELPYHRDISKKISLAKTYLQTKNHAEAIKVWAKIIELHPECKEARLCISQSLFALSENDIEIYNMATHYLAGQAFTDSEIKQIREYVPQKYYPFFDQSFEKVRT